MFEAPIKSAASTHYENLQNLKALVDELPSSDDLYTDTLDALGQRSRDWIASPQVAGYAQTYDDALISYIDEYDWAGDLNAMSSIMDDTAHDGYIETWLKRSDAVGVSHSISVCENNLTQFRNNVIEIADQEGVDTERFDEHMESVLDDVARARGYASVAKESFSDLQKRLIAYLATD